jgi:hypothetical protein
MGSFVKKLTKSLSKLFIDEIDKMPIKVPRFGCF